MIICGNPKAQYLHYKTEIDAAILKSLEHGHYILGPEVEAFEKEFASYIESKHCITVANGTDAIALAIRACGIGHEGDSSDEVITVAHTAVATVAAIELAGATAVIADIDENYFTIDPAKVEELITPKTKAIVAVHIYGQAADLDTLKSICKKHDLWLIEDCAQCHGARLNGTRLGSIGDISCFSFYPTKNLGALGDGGAVVTNNQELADKTRLLRQYGWRTRYISECAGVNSRLDEVQAAVLRIKLRHLDEDNARRKEIAGIYFNELKNLPITLPAVRAGVDHVFHLFVISLSNREQVISKLNAQQIFPLIHYPVPIHLQQAYLGKLRTSTMDVTENAANTVLSLPMYPELTGAEVFEVIETLKSCY